MNNIRLYHTVLRDWLSYLAGWGKGIARRFGVVVLKMLNIGKNRFQVNNLLGSITIFLMLLSEFGYAQNPTKSYNTGAYIIDMGQPNQTIANGLKPYGLVYALLKAGIPVDWSINSAKAKDGTDFNAVTAANGNKAYKGGSFIIAVENLTPTEITTINTWKAMGVVVDGPTTSSFTAPVYRTLTKWPIAFLDAQNDPLVTPYYSNAGVPSSSYVLNANPSMLPQCGSISGELDVYILPHADPNTWDATWIAALQNFINNGGSLWAGCHAVSAIENLPGCNFLTNGGLVPWGSHGNGTPPYAYNSPGNPYMQFIGSLDGATQNGSEQIYVPGTLGWRSTTTISVNDQNYTNGGTSYPNSAAIIAYGPAFGTKGLVMYEAGHRLDQSGTVAEQVAAQRAFLNFLLDASTQTQQIITPPDIANQSVSTCTGSAFTSSPSGAPLNTTYTWSAPTGSGFSGGSAQTVGQTSISQTLTNLTSAVVTATYTITPKTGGCVGHTFTLTVTVNPTSTITVAPASPSICVGSSISLTASGASTYSWSPSTGLSATTGATVMANPTATTTYTITGTDASGCSNSGSVTVTLNSSSVIASATPNPLCVGSTLNLSSSNTFLATNLLSENFNTATNGWTKINNSTGGTPANAAWTLRPNGYKTNCSGDNTPIHSNDNTQFYLSNSCAQGNGGTTATILQSPVMSTLGYNTLALDFYHFFYFYTGAVATVQASTDGSNWTTVATYSTINQGSPSAFAHSIINLNSYISNATFYIRFKYDAPWSWYWAIDNVTVSGTISSPISWTGPNGFTSALQNPSISNIAASNAGVYKVTYTDPVTTCTSSNSVSVNVNALPAISVTPTSPTICLGSSTVLTASGGVTYSWTPSTGLSSTTGQIVTANPITTTTYTVTGTDANGCSNTAIVEVAVNSLPTISVTPASATICRGSSTSLTVSGAASYSWTPSTGLSSTTGATVNASPVITTTYIVTGTNGVGCTNAETVTVTVIPSPVTTGVTICPGGTGSLTSSSTCPAGSSITVGPGNAGSGTNTTPVGGTVAWKTPGNAISIGGGNATVDLNGPGVKTSLYLTTTNYNFTTIPSNAIIVGISVSIGRFENDVKAGNDVKDVGVYLLKGGAIAGDNYADISTEWPKATLTAATYGGTSDLWGTTWSVAEIQASNFGVSLNVNSENDRTASVDYIQISVTYALPGTLNWYTASSGGLLLGSGSPFNPVGIANSGLPNTIVPGIYTFYAECSSDNRCRTATNFTINPVPSINALSTTACSGSAFAVTPVDITNGAVPAGTTYSWGLPSGTGFIGGATGSGAANISGTLTITTSGQVTATYTITPTSGTCAGNAFTLTVTLPPALNPGTINTIGGNYCIGGNANINGTSSPYGAASGGNSPLTYQWEQSYQAGTGCSGSWTAATGTNNGTSYDPPAFITTGTYCYRRMVTDGCGTVAYSGVATFNVYADLVSNTVSPSPNSSSVCAGTAVSATFSGGSGGAPGLYADRDSVSTNGGVTWIQYAGGPINTTGLSGNNIVQIKTRRVAITVAGCTWGTTNTYSWTVNSLPTLFNVTGGGSYCAGGSGVTIGLDGSETGVNYQLQLGGSNIGGSVAGTGTLLSFGLQTATGNYTVVTTNVITGCTLPMTGSQNITINPLPTTSPIYHR